MNRDKCTAIDEYLKRAFPNSDIEQANFSECQHYKIQTENDLLMLKVGEEFIGDTSLEDIIQNLEKWEVPSLLKENSRLGILITRTGASIYERN